MGKGTHTCAALLLALALGGGLPAGPAPADVGRELWRYPATAGPIAPDILARAAQMGAQERRVLSRGAAADWTLRSLEPFLRREIPGRLWRTLPGDKAQRLLTGAAAGSRIRISRGRIEVRRGVALYPRTGRPAVVERVAVHLSAGDGPWMDIELR